MNYASASLRQVISVTLALAVMGLGAGSAAADTPSSTPAVSGTLDEIVVTSQRREERLQDVPISVSVFSQALMDAQGVRTVDDLSRLTPGVSFTRGAVNNNSDSSDIAIRGIDSTAGAATTGIYIDDTPIQSRHLSFGTFNAYPALFDIERVEVLRGPQGTLFGSGSEGGTIRFITPEPGLQKYSAYVRSELAETAHGDPVYELGAAAGGPIVADTLGFRASASIRHEGGYIDRVDWHTGNVVDHTGRVLPAARDRRHVGLLADFSRPRRPDGKPVPDTVQDRQLRREPEQRQVHDEFAEDRLGSGSRSPAVEHFVLRSQPDRDDRLHAI